MFLLVNSIELVLGTSTDVLVEEEESEQKNGNAETWLIPDKTGYDSLVLMCDPELELDEIAATLEDEVTYGDLILSTPTLQLCITAAIGLGGIMSAATKKTKTFALRSFAIKVFFSPYIINSITPITGINVYMLGKGVVSS